VLIHYNGLDTFRVRFSIDAVSDLNSLNGYVLKSIVRQQKSYREMARRSKIEKNQQQSNFFESTRVEKKFTLKLPSVL